MCYLLVNYLITFLVITLAVVYHSACIQRTLTYLIMAPKCWLFGYTTEKRYKVL